jgi:hypothetical protein
MDHADHRPREVGLVLSHAETDRLWGVVSAAERTLAFDEDDRDVPQDRRLAPQLERAFTDLLRRAHQAERASVRLDVPVRLDPAETATVLGLLDQAADCLDAFAARRAQGRYVLGPERFRAQAATARAWHTDLVGLATRQAERAVACRQPTERGEAGDGR